MVDDEIDLPALTIAARRLGMNAGDQLAAVEAAIHAWDSGQTEREAMRMALVDYLRRRGLYDGPLKELVDSGRVFQLREGGDHDRRGARRMGRRSAGPDSAAPAARGKRAAVDAG